MLNDFKMSYTGELERVDRGDRRQLEQGSVEQWKQYVLTWKRHIRKAACLGVDGHDGREEEPI